MEASKIIFASLPDWAAEIPYQIKKVAVKEAYRALYAGIKKFKKTQKSFCLSFRSIKNQKQSCYVPKSAIKQSAIFPTYSGFLKISETIPEEPRDSRLVYENYQWHLLIPVKVRTTRRESQARVVALDPGVRTFLTGFAEDGAFKIGDGAYSRIQRLCSSLDKIISRMATVGARKRKRLKYASARIRVKIRNLIDEIHFKSARFLVNSYDLILLPTFETQAMVRRATRKIRSKTARSMLTFAHFRFRQRLKSLAARCGSVVIDVCEAYTSKTASWTGEIKKIGGAKQISSHGETVDRDLNGARGIFLRALVDLPLLQHQAEV